MAEHWFDFRLHYLFAAIPLSATDEPGGVPFSLIGHSRGRAGAELNARLGWLALVRVAAAEAIRGRR